MPLFPNFAIRKSLPLFSKIIENELLRHIFNFEMLQKTLETNFYLLIGSGLHNLQASKLFVRIFNNLVAIIQEFFKRLHLLAALKQQKFYEYQD
jgi:hypothetical protein